LTLVKYLDLEGPITHRSSSR